ncbi:MAG: peptide deformylase [Planctomycetota bacterium]
MNVLKYPDPCLNDVADEVRAVGEDVKSLAAEMLSLMYASRGIGLAAPQVGVPKRLIVVNLASDPEEGEEIVLVNPVTMDRDATVEVDEEGCLSLPGVTARVPRWKSVRVRGLDLEGCERVVEAEGLLSRVLQHEMDHLEGILFISKVSPVDRVAIKPKLRALKENAR